MLTDKTWNPELLLRLVCGFLLCLGLAGIIPGLLLGKAALETDEGRFAALVFFSLIMHGGGLLLVSFFLRNHGMTWSQGFGFLDCPPAKAVATGVAMAMVFLPVAWMLGQLSAAMMELLGSKPEVQHAVEILQKSQLPMQQFFFGLMAIVFAPVVEELFFRGVFYTALKQAGHPRGALWISSLLFALTHLNVMTFVPLTALALLLVWLYERTGSLLTCIAAHSFFNLVNFVLLVNQPAIEEWLKSVQGVTW